eukprot:5332827-Prymnesium_polylepis.1
MLCAKLAFLELDTEWKLAFLEANPDPASTLPDFSPPVPGLLRALAPMARICCTKLLLRLVCNFTSLTVCKLVKCLCVQRMRSDSMSTCQERTTCSISTTPSVEATHQDMTH